MDFSKGLAFTQLPSPSLHLCHCHHRHRCRRCRRCRHGFFLFYFCFFFMKYKLAFVAALLLALSLRFVCHLLPMFILSSLCSFDFHSTFVRRSPLVRRSFTLMFFHYKLVLPPPFIAICSTFIRRSFAVHSPFVPRSFPVRLPFVTSSFAVLLLFLLPCSD